MSRPTAEWFTHVRVERLLPSLRVIHEQPPPGVDARRAPRIVWNSSGGPYDEVAEILDVLVDLVLVTERAGYLRTTKLGRQLATQDHQTGGRGMARTLLRAGIFADQTRRLLELSSRVSDGSLTCTRTVARANAPQLLGLLRRWADVTVSSTVVIPSSVAVELEDPWSLVHRPEPTTDAKKAIGDRAELYSYLQERMLADDASSIRWVSRDDEGLGYDIEDLASSPSRRIEVKGTAGTISRFFMSAHEWMVAHEQPCRYEIQFWGRIDLNIPERSEFDRLRELGYPIVFRDLEACVRDGRLAASVETFRLRAGEPSEAGVRH